MNHEEQFERVSLDLGDGEAFSSSLDDNDFGIQDTQILANKDLNKFLLSDPDKVKKVEDTKPTDEEQPEEEDEPEVVKKKREAKPLTEKEKQDKKNTDFNKILLEDEDDDAPATEDSPEPEENTYKTLGRDLLRLGVFSKASEDETEETINTSTPEEFLERFTLEKKKGAISILDNFLSQFGEEHKKMFDAVFVNGVDPKAYLDSFTRTESIQNLDLNIEKNQEKVLKAYYRSLKWPDEKIDQKIAKLKDYGELQDEASSYHEVLLNKEKESMEALEKQKIADREIEKDKELSYLKSLQRVSTEASRKQEINGLPITPKEAEEIVAYMSNKPYKLPSGELLTEYDKDLLELNRPENLEQKLFLGFLMRKKFSLDGVKTTKLSDKSKELFSLTEKSVKQKGNVKQMKSFF